MHIEDRNACDIYIYIYIGVSSRNGLLVFLGCPTCKSTPALLILQPKNRTVDRLGCFTYCQPDPKHLASGKANHQLPSLI